MITTIGIECWDKVSENYKKQYIEGQYKYLMKQEVYADYLVNGCVVDESDHMIRNYDPDKGHLVPKKLTEHYPEVLAVEPQYDSDGKIVRPGMHHEDAFDQEIQVYVYTPFTPEEQAEHDKQQAEMKLKAEQEKAMQEYMKLLVPTNLMAIDDANISKLTSIVPAFEPDKDYVEKAVVKFNGKDYRAKTDVKANDLNPDVNDKWYEVK